MLPGSRRGRRRSRPADDDRRDRGQEQGARGLGRRVRRGRRRSARRRGEQRREDVQGDEHLPHADADRRAAIGLSPTAYSSRPKPAGAARRRWPRELAGRQQAVRDEPERHPAAEPARASGRRGRGDHRQLVHARARAPPGRREGHDQRVDAEQPDADAVDEPTTSAAPKARSRPRPAALVGDCVATTKAVIDATVATDRSMPPVSIDERLAGGEDRQRGRKPDDAPPSPRHDARLHDLQDDESAPSRMRSGISRCSRTAAATPDRRPRRARPRRWPPAVIALPPRRVMNPTTMTTRIMIEPWITVL